LYFCLGPGCNIVDEIVNGRLNVLNEGAKLEVVCNLGYIIDGPGFIYCTDHLVWNDTLKGCKGKICI